ncbi:hypothetical protein M408DRAFT_329177 [Serendipita vermifera MAFF 305830]|uniref:TECPR1-like DysF domain-containing protein n=1 Tax=Serendipita vermifera MAFF 305830 TaxID=933852 RepID=A0A0C3B9E1_SERVB|nr:hypothetical protein M408DRAFT_329177 [Serendipita vermifera MAFF 305830]
MTSLEAWVQVPPYATPVARDNQDSSISQTSLAAPSSPRASKRSDDQAVGRDKSEPRSSLATNLTNAVLSAALNVPAPTTPSNPRKTEGRLLSTRDSLSIPITTVNFRRFVSKSGAVFWLQDRVEEVIFWRRGWKVTAAWMAAYSFLCYYPRLILVLPHMLILSILYVTYNVRYPVDANEDAAPAPPWKPMESREGSSEWFANLQAIQNLMGFYADLYDNVVPILPHLSHATPTSAPLLSFTLVTLLLSLPLLPLIPLRPTFLILGLTPFVLTHPTTQQLLPLILSAMRKLHAISLQRIIDNDRLDDVAWSAPLKDVELWENERWATGAGTSTNPADAGWSKSNLKRGERKGWSRRRDGWSDADALSGSLDGDVRNLTFTLEPGWHFVNTEDWRSDIAGSWVPHIGADQDGWVYTNDVWNEPHAEAPEEWK